MKLTFFIFSSKQSGDEKEFAVAREGKLEGRQRLRQKCESNI